MPTLALPRVSFRLGASRAGCRIRRDGKAENLRRDGDVLGE
jgi:hypothetical protein